ncbi:CENP-S associating centromere protein X-domain-containing protein [Ampelomyces quisqualis]|uniref:CENP-S associating centromere protein X-domain-containing protein n=1 Tax=Ampelomyces quisqualis TaxID=50730 RepID=A0A6A5QIE7_AMPQU|nr:CENP-S associating centromere protein X-domain-containing protein [Ampelomyces quisqualis]
MAAHTAAAKTAPRKGAQFKPPRPVKDVAQGSAATKRAQTGAAKKSATRAPQPVAEIISSDDEEHEEPELDENDDDLMEDAPPPARNARPAPAIPADNPIPPALLARLLYENFEDPNTQIQKGAMSLVGKYMEIFVREAFARAKHERERSVKAGGISDGFLQVEDLEKLAPQLVLDF